MHIIEMEDHPFANVQTAEILAICVKFAGDIFTSLDHPFPEEHAIYILKSMEKIKIGFRILTRMMLNPNAIRPTVLTYASSIKYRSPNNEEISILKDDLETDQLPIHVKADILEVVLVSGLDEITSRTRTRSARREAERVSRILGIILGKIKTRFRQHPEADLTVRYQKMRLIARTLIWE